MRRTSAILAALMTLAACGGDTDTGATTTDTSEARETVVVTEPGTDTTMRGTDNTTLPTVAETTSTTEAATYPGLDAALAAAGTYSGTWTNTTFGSTGEAAMTMTVTESGDVTMEWDLGGFVFGATDPDGETQMLNVEDLIGGRVLQTDLFGEIEIDVSEDFTTLTMTADDVPTDGIATFMATAVWSEDGTISGTYLVEFSGGGEPAEGEFEMTRG